MSYQTLEKTPKEKSKKGRERAGPPTWDVLHCYAAAYKYSLENKIAAKNLVDSIKYLFPCDTCRIDFSKNCIKIPIDNYLNNNHDFFLWTYLQHDLTNQIYNKSNPNLPPKISPPFQRVKSEYFKAMAENECKECQVK